MIAEFAARGISEKALMTEYQMRDVPAIIEYWRREDAKQALQTLNIRAVPYMDEADRDKYLRALRDQAYGGADESSGYVPDDECDIEALLALRAGGAM
jgi:hypothetical protein